MKMLYVEDLVESNKFHTFALNISWSLKGRHHLMPFQAMYLVLLLVTYLQKQLCAFVTNIRFTGFDNASPENSVCDKLALPVTYNKEKSYC
jgi:hypothetical protein